MSGKLTKYSDQPLENVQHLLSELTSKRLNLSTWIQKALLYYGQRQFESFVLLLESGIIKSGKSYNGYKDDLIQSYMLLAGHFTRVAYRETGNRRTALQAKVTNLFNAVDELQPNNQKHLVIRGYALMLSAARAQDADNHFVTILKKTSYNVPSLIGRGCLAYNRQEYIGALGYFKSVLMHFPRGPADVRVGVGHCFLKMNNADSARRAFELALEHNGKCQNALVGMALLKLNMLEKQTHQEGINLMCAAFEQFNRHPVVLTCLAAHHYYVRKYEMVRTLAANAIAHTDNAELRGQNYYQIGRSYHATGDYDKAFDFYKMALKARPDGYGPPHLGIAQMYVRRNQLAKAQSYLESLLKIIPDQVEGLRLLSILYIRDNSGSKVDMALEMLKKAMELSPGMKKDYNLWLNLAKAYEHKELWPLAINAYKEAIEIHEKQGRIVPIELFNNLAVAQMHAKKPNDALVSIERALFMLASQKYALSEATKNNRLTLRFNRGRVLEELNRDDVAESLYKELIDECPTYYDCYIRLGQMAAKRNQCVIAMDYYKDVLKEDNDNMTVRSIMGNYYMKQGMTTQAMYCHNVILRNRETHRDPYTMVSVGNVCLINIQRSMAVGDERTAKRHQEKGILLFKRALEENPRNLWAANGIGAALCSRGLLTEGEIIFKQILESGKQCTQAMINSANVALELKQYKQASQTYKQCLEEHLPPNSLDVMQLLARSLYQGGRIKEAKMLLLKARHILPHDPVLLYNLALAIKEYSDMIFAMQRPELADLNRAEQELKVALRYFEYLNTIQKDFKVSKRALERQTNKCRELLANLPEELSRVQTQEQQDESRRQLQEQRYQELQKQLEQERLHRQEKEIQLREEQKAKRLEIIKRTKSILTKEKKQPQKRTTKNKEGNPEEDGNTDAGPSKKGRKGETTAKRPRKSYKSKALVIEDDADDLNSNYSETEKPHEKAQKEAMGDLETDHNDEVIEEPVEESEDLMDRLKTIGQRRQVEMDNFMDARDSGNLDETEGETPQMLFEYMETLKKKMQTNSK